LLYQDIQKPYCFRNTLIGQQFIENIINIFTNGAKNINLYIAFYNEKNNKHFVFNSSNKINIMGLGYAFSSSRLEEF